MKNILYILLVSIITFSNLHAQETISPQEVPPFVSEQARGSGGVGGVGFGESTKAPIDMYTSALLIAGIGLIASYTYFARRRKTI